MRRSPLLTGLVILLAAGCVRTYDLTVDNRTVTSLTLRVYTVTPDGKYDQFPDRIFQLPPNREFVVRRAFAALDRDGRRLFEFRRPDEQIVDSFILSYAEIEEVGGRLTVPRSLAEIPRGAPPEPGFVDSTAHERIDYIPLFPEEGSPRSGGGPPQAPDSAAAAR